MLETRPKTLLKQIGPEHEGHPQQLWVTILPFCLDSKSENRLTMIETASICRL